MASNKPDVCCTVGVRHEGTAHGELKKIGQTECYISYPEDKAQTENGIVIFPDVIGHNFLNAQLIADQLAKNGYLVVLVDTFNGDPIPLNRPAGFDLQKWMKNGSHFPSRIDSVCTDIIKHMRNEMGVKQLGAMGYCFGAKYVVRFLGTVGETNGAKLDAGYVAHPSFVDAEELSAIKGPLSIAAAETDQIFPKEKRHESEEILEKLSKGPEKIPYQINLYSGVMHGFGVRADPADPVAIFAKEMAFLQAVHWMQHFVLGKNLN